MSTVDIHDLAINGKLSELQQELANNPSRIEEKNSVCENILFIYLFYLNRLIRLVYTFSFR